MTRRTAYIN